MRVNLKRMDIEAPVPFKTFDSDFCYDMVAVSEEEIAPHVWKYRLGWAMQLVRDNEELIKVGHHQKMFDLRHSDVKLSIDIRSRSSVWKTGMVLSNCIGTVDENFTGEVSVVFYHVLPHMPRYRVGDRVCQMKVGFTLPLDFEVMEELQDTDRGDGSYGSTGK